MRRVRIVTPIQLQTTAGLVLLDAQSQPLQVKQVEFLQAMAGEPAFLGARRGIAAACFQAQALAEIQLAFGEDGTGLLSDEVLDALTQTIQTTTVSVDYGGKPFTSAVLWCFLPFMRAILEATPAEP